MTDNRDLQDIGETEELRSGGIINVPITREMKKAYLDYAMSVIVARALPDVRDGLKPVHRRIIYAAHEMGLTADSKFSKCANLVGRVMGRFHPHGDASIYDALVRMAQLFSLRYPLIEGQGNFGTVDGDEPAAMRYTECRLERISDYLLKDIDKETVEFVDNYSVELQEPTVLPAIIPNLLINGLEGIAVGMATKIPPHNLGEVVDAIRLILDSSKINIVSTEAKKIRAYDLVETEAEIKNWSLENTVTFEEILKILPGPDFPTGCTIYDKSETLNYFATGRGRIVQRAKAEIKEEKNGKFVIEVTEIPYQVNKSLLVEKIASLVSDKKIKEISAISDLSSGDSIKVHIELKREARPQKVLNYLYKYTPLQSAFSVNMLALVNGEPQTLNIKEYFKLFVEHRRDIITNRTIFLLRKAREREHILEGLKKALDFIDEVIQLIKTSKDSEEAKVKLVKKFDLTEIQAQAILDMQLRRLAALEREKIESELKEIQASINNYLIILKTPEVMIKEIISELTEIKEKFGDIRKTKVVKGKIGDFEEEDLIANESTLISVTESGYIKRMKPSTYKTQSRGGKGVMGMKTKEEDDVAMLRLAETHDRLFFFTSVGKIYEKRVWDIPEASRTSKGTAVVNIIEAGGDEKLEEVITLDKQAEDNKNNLFLLIATKKGQIKKSSLSEYDNIRRNGIISIHLKEGDKLIRALLTTGTNNVLIVTKNGKSIRFKETDVRPMGRSASGVRGINLKKGDEVVGMEVISEVDNSSDLIFVVTENGHGKATKLSEYPIYNRGGSGVKASNINAKTGLIANVKLISDTSVDIIMSSESGQIIRLPAKSVPILGRDTQGVILMRLNQGDRVSSVSIVENSEEKEE